MSDTTIDKQLDADGIEIIHHERMVLVVLPPAGFGEQNLRYVRSTLMDVHVGTRSVSTETEELVKGRLQDEFLVDYALEEANMDDYSGILLAGDDGQCSALSGEAKVLDLVRKAAAQGKLLAAWGNAVGILAEAGVLKRKKVTGSDRVREQVLQAGARWTGREVAQHENIVTARDEAAGMRFAQSVVAALGPA